MFSSPQDFEYRRMDLLIKHVVPEKPGWQLQVNPLGWVTHWPPFTHGLGKQLFASTPVDTETQKSV